MRYQFTYQDKIDAATPEQAKERFVEAAIANNGELLREYGTIDWYKTLKIPTKDPE